MGTPTNRSAAASAPDLPDLQPGVTLIDVDDDLGVTPVQALLLDRLLMCDGDVYWVDADGSARTSRLRELAPHRRLLDRVRVARGFTAYQHASLIDRLHGRITNAPAVVVATGVDRLYRDDDVPAGQDETLFLRTIATLARLARTHGVPVVVTRSTTDAFSRPLANAAPSHLHCRATPFGPRFEDDAGGTETLVYRVADGWMQTTLAYWQDVLAHRVRMHEGATVEDAIAGPIGVQ